MLSSLGIVEVTRKGTGPMPDDKTQPQGQRIGARVAAERKLRGLSQRQLAGRAQISYSLLTKVEAGHAPATPAFIGAVARALRVDIPKITGQPYQEPGTQVIQLQETIEPLRRVLLTWDLPP